MEGDGGRMGWAWGWATAHHVAAEEKNAFCLNEGRTPSRYCMTVQTVQMVFAKDVVNGNKWGVRFLKKKRENFLISLVFSPVNLTILFIHPPPPLAKHRKKW